MGLSRSLAVDFPIWNSPLSNACQAGFKKVVVFYVWAKKVHFVHLYFYFLTIMLILDAHSSPKKSRKCPGKCSQFYNALKAKKNMSLS